MGAVGKNLILSLFLLFMGEEIAFGMEDNGFLLREASIVCGPNVLCGDSPWGSECIRALTNVVWKTTGRLLPIYPENEARNLAGPRIFLGNTHAAREAGIDVEGMRAGEFRLLVTGDRAFVAARTGSGTAFGVTEFLRRFSDYWFLTVADDDPVTVEADRRVTACDITAAPAITSRDVYHNMFNSIKHPETDVLWHRWTMMRRAAPGDLDRCDRVSVSCGAFSHTTFKYCPPAGHFAENPELFSMSQQGLRQHAPVGQLCYSNPQTLRICLESLRTFIAKDRARDSRNAPLVYDFTQQDNTDWLCWCPACRKTIAKYNRIPGGHKEGGDAGLQLEFVNSLAREIAKEHPDVIIRTFAYNSTEEPPTGIAPEPNVMIWLCDLYSACDHMLPLEHPFNARRADLIRRWTKIAKHFEIWDYMLYSSKDPPEISADAIAADAKFFRSLGVSRVLMETEYYNQAFYELNFFLLSELYFNPDLDVNDLVRTYCRVYGKGARDMERAIGFLREIISSNPPADTTAWCSRRLGWRTVANMTRFAEMVRKGYAREAEGPVRARMAKVLAATSLELMRLLRILPCRAQEAARAKSDYVRYAKEDAAFAVMEAGDRSKALCAIDDYADMMDLTFRDMPTALKGVAKSEYECFDWRRIGCEPNAQRLEDPDSERGHAAVWKLGRPHPVKFTAGVYDRQLKTNASFNLPLGEEAKDVRYHWYRLGIARLGRDSVFYVPSDWGISFRGLADYYIECDGMAKDPNWYEFWISVKYNTKPNGLWVDRMIMRHVDPPATGQGGGK